MHGRFSGEAQALIFGKAQRFSAGPDFDDRRKTREMSDDLFPCIERPGFPVGLGTRTAADENGRNRELRHESLRPRPILRSGVNVSPQFNGVGDIDAFAAVLEEVFSVRKAMLIRDQIRAELRFAGFAEELYMIDVRVAFEYLLPVRNDRDAGVRVALFDFTRDRREQQVVTQRQAIRTDKQRHVPLLVAGEELSTTP